MKELEIQQLMKTKALPGESKHIELLETHISWVILNDDFAFKIKKPLQFSFLDFSTLEKRKFYCEQELELNRRLSQGIYLQVLPIRKKGSTISIGNSEGEVLDYCVQMKRMDNKKEMKTLLETGNLQEIEVLKIAKILAGFHQETEIIKGKITAEGLFQDFADLLQAGDFIQEHLGQSARQLLYKVVTLGHSFLIAHKDRIYWRDYHWYTRDCHGDLHSGNIFILEEPVIFDCIEFNEHFRQIDVLNEIAFFCMDLEFYGRGDLSRIFIENYQKEFPAILNKEDELLLLFYKMYRANIKLKVNALKAMQATSPSVFKRRLALTEQYMALLKNYYEELLANPLAKTLDKKYTRLINNNGRNDEAQSIHLTA